MIVNKPKLVNKEYTDGKIRKKDGTILTIDDQLYPEDIHPEKVFAKKEELPENGITPPRWSPLLLAIQHLNLRMRYKPKTKVKTKLMRDVKKHVPRKEPSIRWEPKTSRSRHMNLRLDSWTASSEPIYRPEIRETKGETNSVTTGELKALTSVSHHLSRWDITQGFRKKNYPEDNVLVQCMNAIRSPNRKIPKTKRVLKLITYPF
jgi:hypothetical protein